MKQLRVPLIPLLDSLAVEKVPDLLEEQGSRGSVESVNWNAVYPYLPITFFYLGRSATHLWVKFSVRGNVLAAVYHEDQKPVYDDSCVGLLLQTHEKGYFFEFYFNCISSCYAAYCGPNRQRELLPKVSLESIVRVTSLERNPFKEMLGMFSWEMTAGIPFSTLKLNDENLPKSVGVNFIKCADNTSLRHYVSWNPILAPEPDFHHPECFGRLLFD